MPAPGITRGLNHELRSRSAPEIFRKRPFLIDPLRLRDESGLAGNLGNLRRVKLMGRFRPDRLTLPETAFQTSVSNRHHLVTQGAQMHLDPASLAVIAGLVRKGALIEIAAEFPVDTAQKVQIKRSRHTRRIVIGLDHGFSRLHQVESDQHRVTRAQTGPDLAQEIAAAAFVEIADRAAEEKNQDRRPVPWHAVQPVQISRLDRYHASKTRECAGTMFEGGR